MKFAEVLLPLPLKQTFSYAVPETCSCEDILLKRVKVPFGNKELTGYVIDVKDTDNKLKIKLKNITEIIDKAPVITKEILEMSIWLSERYLCSQGEALSAAVPVSLKVPKRKKTLQQEENFSVTQKINLTAYQQHACDEISSAIRQNQNKNFLLHGVTGSGKTEVYLRAIQNAVNNNKSAIFLLPEISLTPQFINILNNRFGSVVALWHSNVTSIQKYKIFDAISCGDVKIVVGARSAIFLPFKNLGLVIIDEEHEATYKQNNKPSYNAKEIAIWRAKYNNGITIFGSATPSVETYKQCKDGRFILLEMPKRIDSKPMPKIEMVSLKEVKLKSSVFSKPVYNAIKKSLARREQVVIFLNRRGYSSSVTCEKCDTPVECPDCSIAMVYHRNPEKLKCHYCGREIKFPLKCSKCGNTKYRTLGVGTQRVEQELKQLFPHTKVFRLDADTATSKSIYSKVYEGIKNEEYSILLGTQMIAKGFDFPRVSLVCVVNADMSLYLPDFRSSERTYQLITQVAGRCGRAEIKGKVLIQTQYPDNYALAFAAKYDYGNFYKQEIESRKDLNYPPFCSTAKIVVRNFDEQKAFSFCEKIYAFMEEQINKLNYRIDILGPSQSYIFKLNNSYRWQIILKGIRREIKEVLEKADMLKVPPETYINMELDPMDLL